MVSISWNVDTPRRKTIDGEEQVFVMEGGDTGVGYWYPSDEVTLTKGKWTNANAIS